MNVLWQEHVRDASFAGQPDLGAQAGCVIVLSDTGFYDGTAAAHLHESKSGQIVACTKPV